MIAWILIVGALMAAAPGLSAARTAGSAIHRADGVRDHRWQGDGHDTYFPYQIGYADAPPGTHRQNCLRSAPADARRSLHIVIWITGSRRSSRRRNWKVAGPRTSPLGSLPIASSCWPASRRSGPSRSNRSRRRTHASGINSYIVTWHGRRLYFSGDTQDARSLILARNLDVAFVSPWLYSTVMGLHRRIDAKRVRHLTTTRQAQQIPGCAPRMPRAETGRRHLHPLTAGQLNLIESISEPSRTISNPSRKSL